MLCLLGIRLEKTEGITETSKIMTAELAQQWIGDMGYIQGRSVAAAALLMNETRSRGFQGNGHKTFTVSVYSLTSAGTGQLKETKLLLFPWLCISYNYSTFLAKVGIREKTAYQHIFKDG